MPEVRLDAVSVPMIEIERQFLVAWIPDRLPPGDEIVQAYLTVEPVAVRIRRHNGAPSMTVKSGSGLERIECEVAISDADFVALWPQATALRIDKTRYPIDLDGGLVAELDVFHGPLEGHQLVEVEFRTRPDADRFVPPPWFGREVTTDVRYTNAGLARDGWPVAP